MLAYLAILPPICRHAVRATNVTEDFCSYFFSSSEYFLASNNLNNECPAARGEHFKNEVWTRESGSCISAKRCSEIHSTGFPSILSFLPSSILLALSILFFSFYPGTHDFVSCIFFTLSVISLKFLLYYCPTSNRRLNVAFPPSYDAFLVLLSRL